MATTDVKPEALAFYKQESDWCLFLKQLAACDFHVILKGDWEMILHDRYVAGEIELLDIVDAIINPDNMAGLVGAALKKAEPDKDAEQKLLDILDRRKKISDL